MEALLHYIRSTYAVFWQRNLNWGRTLILGGWTHVRIVLLYHHVYHIRIFSGLFSHQRRVLGLHSYSCILLLNPNVEVITSFVLMKVEHKMDISQKVFICWPPCIWAEGIVRDGVEKNNIICLLQTDMAENINEAALRQQGRTESANWL